MVRTSSPVAEGGQPDRAPAASRTTGSDWLNPDWVRTDRLAFFKFTAVGTPKAKARPRVVRNKNTGLSQTYTPVQTVNWEGAIGWQAKQALTRMVIGHPGEFDVLPLAGRLVVGLRFNIGRPKSLPKSVEYPVKTRPGDLDNMAKAVLDALQAVGIIKDDCQVTDMDAVKRFADEDHPEGVEIQLTAWL